MLKIKKGDKVIVTAGKDKGRSGTVLKVVKKLGLSTKVLVEGVAIIKKHVKANPQAQEPGGIKDQESAIDISNVAILNPNSNKADKVGFKTLENGSKVRYFKSNGEVVDV